MLCWSTFHRAGWLVGSIPVGLNWRVRRLWCFGIQKSWRLSSIGCGQCNVPCRGPSVDACAKPDQFSKDSSQVDELANVWLLGVQFMSCLPSLVARFPANIIHRLLDRVVRVEVFVSQTLIGGNTGRWVTLVVWQVDRANSYGFVLIKTKFISNFST